VPENRPPSEESVPENQHIQEREGVPENQHITILPLIMINGGYVADDDASVQSSMQAIAEKRRDCFAIFDIPYDMTEISPLTNASNWRLNLQNIESSFCALYSPWILCYDSYNDIPKMPTPPSGWAAQVFARTDAVTYPWYAPAGYNRAVLRSETLPPQDVSVRYEKSRLSMETLSTSTQSYSHQEMVS
jgi:hypothetical protein